MNKIAIDSHFIEVFGKKYQKTAPGWGNKKTTLGYRLSVAFDTDSKLTIANIITFGSRNDSNFLIPLIEIVKSKYRVTPEGVVMDRAYYGKESFAY